MKVTPNTLTAAQIREMHNGFLDGTATDAIGRHLCRVALGELCIATENAPMPERYPTEDEIREAKRRLASHWNRGQQ